MADVRGQAKFAVAAHSDSEVARIPTVQSPTDEQRKVLATTPLTKNGSPFRVFSVLAHSPSVLEGVNTLGRAFHTCSLSDSDRELVVMRVAARCASRYVFEHHARSALRAGVGYTSIDALRRGEIPTNLEPEKLALIAFTDDLLDDDSVDDNSWHDLFDRADFAQMAVELTMLIGFYRMISGLTNVARLPLEDAGANDSPRD